MAFQDMIIRFRPSKNLQLPLKVVLPPPRQYLQSLTLIAEISQQEMMEHQELALHLLGGPSLQKFTIEGRNGLKWLNGHDQCFFVGLRRPLEQHRGQRVVRLPHRVRGSPSTSFTFE